MDKNDLKFLGGVFLGGGLVVWFLAAPPWHLIERTEARGVACVLLKKVGQETITTRSGKTDTIRTEPLGGGSVTYRAIADLPQGATIADERVLSNKLRGHCSAVSNSPLYFPSVVEITPVYGEPKEWEANGYTKVTLP
jgi:hypothetical protein